MNNPLIGVEIGHKNLKIIYGIKKKDIFNIEICNLIELEEVINDGFILDTEILKEKILTFIKTNKIKTKNIVINIQSSTILIRNITIPKLKKVSLNKIIELQKQEYFPIDISNYQINYKLNENLNIDTIDNYELTVIAIPNNLLEQYIKLFESLNLNIINININSNSLVELFKIEAFCNDNAIAIIDIGAKTTTLSITSNGKLFFYKMLSFNTIDNLINEINTYISFYKSKFEVPLTKIYLVGGNAYLENIKNYFDIDVIFIDSISLLIQNKLIIHTDNILYFASLLGLVTNNIKKFNLLPKKYISIRNNKKLKIYYKYLFIILSIILFLSTIVLNIVNIQKRELLLNINLNLENIKYNEIKDINNILNETNKEFEMYNKISDSIKDDSIIESNIIQTILNYIPNSVYVNNININNTNKHIVINGTTSNNKNLIMLFLEKIQQTKSFKNLTFNFNYSKEQVTIPYTIEFDVERIEN